MLRQRMHPTFEVGEREVRRLERRQRALTVLRRFAEAPHLMRFVGYHRLPDQFGQRGEVVAADIFEVSFPRGRNRIALLAFAEALGLALETSDALEVLGAQPQAIFRICIDAFSDTLAIDDINRHVTLPREKNPLPAPMLLARGVGR